MPTVMLIVFTLTLFFSATLLFIIEPMVGKMMLPLLGGTPAVWNTCMLFFQAVVLAGYLYAHVTTKWLGPRVQASLHLAVIALPVLSFALNFAFVGGMLSPNEQIILAFAGNPIVGLLIVLTLSVGIPMFVVCTTAPLLSRWFSSTDHPSAGDPYFLYGASNFGSMLSLIGYPFVVEPLFGLSSQQVLWVIMSITLALMIASCAFLMWRAKPAPALSESILIDAPPAATTASTNIKQDIRAAAKKDKAIVKPPREEDEILGPSSAPVTWFRRLRWIALGAVPSSLMLAVSTYITTDIAAIPLLWIMPLTLYLLTFIIVFAKISQKTQAILTQAGLGLLLVGVITVIAPRYLRDDNLIFLTRVIGCGLLIFSFQIWRIRDPMLIHRVMILVMPLVLLLLIFMMLSGMKPDLYGSIAIHATSLFIVSMVCHGELALDRPRPENLTEFFLLMSVGGVVGGLFNALIAPITFNSLAEYPLMMVVACLLLPPLGLSKDNLWARRADIALAAVFLVVGSLLLYLRFTDIIPIERTIVNAEGVEEVIKQTRDNRPDLKPLFETGAWKFAYFALFVGLGFGVLALIFRWGDPPPEKGAPPLSADEEQGLLLDRSLDIVLPATLLILVLGLFWGLPATPLKGRLANFASAINMGVEQFKLILIFGLPAVLCYTFVERSVRFGLGVGVILLVCNYSLMIEDPPKYQERSFFGVLRVEEGRMRYPVNDPNPDFIYETTRLVHGTTLHGVQLVLPELREYPLSYYHRTGGVGQVFSNYNTDPKRPFAVIGLGTGTMGCYGLPGQRVDFFDIDPVVVDIAYDTNEFFTFTEDALARGVDISLILGDARLTFNTKGEKERLRPLQKRKGQPTPKREFGAKLMPEDRYGLIVVDAFSSDAIPVHLITKEAVKIFFDRLMDDGIVCIHISNRHLDLHPVLANIATELGVTGMHLSDDEKGSPGKNGSHWVALTRDLKNLEKVLTVPRWMEQRWAGAGSGRDGRNQFYLPANYGLGLLGVTWFPWMSGDGQAMGGLTYALQRVVEMDEVEKAKKAGKPLSPTVDTGWEPIETLAYLEKELSELKAAGPKDNSEDAKERYGRRIKYFEEKMRLTKRVGVWSDDYSNILSVFTK